MATGREVALWTGIAVVVAGGGAWNYQDTIRAWFVTDAERLRVAGSLTSTCESGVLVRLTNESGRTLKSARIHIGIFERGVSRDWADASVIWSTILGPGEERSECIRVLLKLETPVLRQPVVQAQVETWDVQFYATGETIPR